MIVDLVEISSGIKRRKELRNYEIYQFYKNHLVPTKNDQLSYTFVTNKCCTYKLYFKMNWLDEKSWLVYRRNWKVDFEKPRFYLILQKIT